MSDFNEQMPNGAINYHPSRRGALITGVALGITVLAGCAGERSAAGAQEAAPVTSEPNADTPTTTLEAPVVITLETLPPEEVVSTIPDESEAPVSTTETAWSTEPVFPYEYEAELLTGIEDEWGFSSDDVVYLNDIAIGGIYCNVRLNDGPGFTFQATAAPYPYEYHRGNGEEALDLEYLIPSDQPGFGFEHDPNAIIGSVLGLAANGDNDWSRTSRTYDGACPDGETEVEKYLSNAEN